MARLKKGPSPEVRKIKEDIKAKARAYYAKNKKRIRQYANTHSRKKHLRRAYGLSLDTYMSMLHQQGSRCAICQGVEPGGNGQFAVDHCHQTGKIRGLLCSSCNTGLGFFKDSPDLLDKAKEYLTK